MTGARGYHGPGVVLTPAEVARVYGWAHTAAAATQLPDEITDAVKAKCEASMNATANPTRGAR